MSYDVRFCVETVRANNDGERYAVVHVPEYDSPTYNLREMFVNAMGWDYHQGSYYPMTEVYPKLRRGLDELTKHPERYRRYEPSNGWGTVKGAVRCIRDWIDELTPLEEADPDEATANTGEGVRDWPLEALWWRW